MNQDQFKQHIETTRDCDGLLLDSAIQKGLLRAKNEHLDIKKFISLAVMSTVTAALCFVINLEPVRNTAADFLLQNSKVTQIGSETLQGYLSGIADTISTYLGGH